MEHHREHVTQYAKRVRIATDVLMLHSKLEEEEATKLAVHVLHALDHIPEKVR